MVLKRRNNIRLERCIYEQFTYFRKLVVYTNSLYVNELGDIVEGINDN